MAITHPTSHRGPHDLEVGEHIILVAFTVEAADRAEAHDTLRRMLNPVLDSQIESTSVATEWWVAEDDRTDGSDRDSAVFVRPGMQAEASAMLHGAGLTPSCNVIGERFDADSVL